MPGRLASGPWPADQPPLAPEARPRVRRLAWAAIAAQILFVAGWAVAAALERGYSPVRMYVSELGRRGAAHPWIFDLSVVVWGAGFVALGFALAPALRARPWGRVAPGLFVLAGIGTMLEAPLRLDCATSVDRGCAARRAAGLLSWHHYGHEQVGGIVVVLLVLTPFALARAQWPGRLARLILLAGGGGVALWAVVMLAGHGHGSAGLWQRLGLAVTHAWVLSCAGVLLLASRALPLRRQ